MLHCRSFARKQPELLRSVRNSKKEETTISHWLDELWAFVIFDYVYCDHDCDVIQYICLQIYDALSANTKILYAYSIFFGSVLNRCQ